MRNIYFVIISGNQIWHSELSRNIGRVYFTTLEEAKEVLENLNSRYGHDDERDICAIVKITNGQESFLE
jgi:hypothetical protein